MANATTEHSKKLRAKTAAQHNKRLFEAGLVKRFSVQIETAVAEELTAVLNDIGGTRTDAIRRLCAIYRANKPA